MKNIHVCAVLEDTEFAKALAKGLIRSCQNLSVDVGDSSGRGAGNGQILLTDRIPEGREDAENMILLVSEPSGDGVFVFEDSSIMAEKILEKFFLLTGERIEYRGKRKLAHIVFLSAAGGCGTTSAAAAVSSMLRKLYGQKCLFHSLSPVDGAADLYREEEERGMLRLLYNIRSYGQKSLSTAASLSPSEVPGFGAIRASAEEEPLPDRLNGSWQNFGCGDMDEDVFRTFRTRIEEEGFYDFLITDIGNHLTREGIAILRACDLAVFVTDGRRRRTVCVRSAEKHLKERCGGSWIRLVDFDDGGSGPSEADLAGIAGEEDGFSYSDESEAEKDPEYYLPEESSAFVHMGGRIRLDLRGGYGSESARLAKKIMEVLNA